MEERNDRKTAKVEEEVVVKKLVLLVWLVLAAWFCAGGLAYAQSASDTVGVSITVDPSFTFAIGETSIAMGNVAPGGTGGGTVTMYCGTNRNIPWTVQIKSTGIISGGNEIPLSCFKFTTYALPDGGGTNSAGTFVATGTAITGADQLAYVCAPAERVDTDVRVGMGLQIVTPFNVESGTYSATVTTTMTE